MTEPVFLQPNRKWMLTVYEDLNSSVGRDLQGSSGPTAEHLRANHKLKHVIEGMGQMPHEPRQARGIKHLAREPVPVSDHP